MTTAIKRRTSPDGLVPSFGLAIDATKVSQVIEVSSGHKAIFGAEHPNDVIDIGGLSKDDVCKILDGKSKEYGKLTPATEIKVCAMCCTCVVWIFDCIGTNKYVPCLIISGCHHYISEYSFRGPSF